MSSSLFLVEPAVGCPPLEQRRFLHSPRARFGGVLSSVMWCCVGADGAVVAVLIGFGVDVVSCGRRCPVVGSSEMSSALCSSVVPVQSAVLLSESGCKVSAVRFCLEWFNGVVGGVGDVAVSACVLSAGLL